MKLEDLRKELDETDSVLEQSFIKRMEIVARVADFKAANNMPTLDSAREQRVLDAHAANVAPEYDAYIRDFFTQLMRISREYQNARREKQQNAAEKL